MEAFRFLLFPFSLCYGLIVKVRNILFDIKILPSKKFELHVISVGNLTAGGSGKTPLVEYLVRLLSPKAQIATLSRGYKRKTTGFILASETDSVETIGDEPMQYHEKFADLKVAVCENRKTGIRQLTNEFPDLTTILLDDAFQHRFVKPELSILVTDYFRLFTKDWLLPYGRLREHITGRKRADIIVVTKTPKIFSPIVRKQLQEEINPYPGQLLCFSYINYLPYVPVYSGNDEDSSNEKVYSIILLTGIGNPGPLQEYLRRQCTDLEVLEFSDHYAFTQKDLLLLKDKFIYLPTKRKIIVTTEKDAKRLQNNEAKEILGDLPVFFVPIEFDFFPADKALFNEKVLSVVTKSSNG